MKVTLKGRMQLIGNLPTNTQPVGNLDEACTPTWKFLKKFSGYHHFSRNYRGRSSLNQEVKIYGIHVIDVWMSSKILCSKKRDQVYYKSPPPLPQYWNKHNFLNWKLCWHPKLAKGVVEHCQYGFGGYLGLRCFYLRCGGFITHAVLPL